MNLGNFYMDINSLVLAGVFLLVFAATMFALRTKGNKNFGKTFLSLIIALFTTWWVSKTGIDFESFFSTNNLQNIIAIIGPMMFLIFLVIIMWKWGISTILVATGSILFIIGILLLNDPILNSAPIIIIGLFLLLVGLLLKARKKIIKIAKKKRETKKDLKKIQKEIKQENSKPREFKDKHRLARLLGIKNLENELLNLQTQFEKFKKQLDEGYERAKKLHIESTKKSHGKWTGSKEGRETYKAWHKQYQKNLEIEKRILPDILRRIKQIENRIEHLKNKI